MKKIIFSLMVLLAGVSFANAQVTLDGTYTGTATNVYMGKSLDDNYDATTTFSSNTMTGISMSVKNHSISLTDQPTFTDNGDGTYTWNESADDELEGTVTTPLGITCSFTITAISDVELDNGKLTYYFEAEVPLLFNMEIHFTFTED